MLGQLLPNALVFVTASIITVAVTPVMKHLAVSLNLVAKPSNDRWHRRPVPLLGGAAIYLGCTAAVLLVGTTNSKVGWALGAGSIMALIGLLDDFITLRPSNKLMAQVVVACAICLGLGQTPWLGWPAIDTLISIFWLVAITNAFNLLDNMDGLCAGVSAIAALAFTVSVAPSEPALSTVGAAVAGAACGFLIFNFHPASIFMGDAGSLFIGATLAVLTLSVQHRETMGVLSTLAFPVLLMMIPLFDTAFVTLSRKLSARKASVGGRDHTSHRLVAMGFPESRAVLLLCAFAALGGTTAITLSHSSFQEASLLTGVLLVGLALLGVRLARVNVYGGADFAALRNKPYTPLLVDFAYKRRVFEVLLDVLLVSLAYYAAYVMRFGDAFPLYRQLFVQSLPTLIGCELAGMYVAGVYRGIWRYISLGDLFTYVRGVVGGGVLTVLALVYLYHFKGYSRGVFIINAMILGLLVVGSRLSFRWLGDLTARHRPSAGRHALICGAGDGGALLARELRNNPRYECVPIGFLDDDPTKLHRSIMGLPVLGRIGDAARILEKRRPAVVIVSTSKLHPTVLVALQVVCERMDTPLMQMQFSIAEVPTSRLAALG
jgi:UDP-GlcNAc:undecaprenyl-phosphate/decaprenyl-phosphate GlcNAc-1-phosphate transferase